ncbi:hypothetical protein RRG08_043278 [Elysia crispata]|uniref:Uncharacterized protein n=1 Tax=Elysia crispata TaxID=231223 RepID=A0AAE0XXP3_9GAST|nr:hypothetical protein RRG08_043278 [Elysia crispata]
MRVSLDLAAVRASTSFLLLEVSNHRSDHIKSQERTESETILRALSPPFRGSFFPDPSRKKKQSKKHFREEPKKQKLNDIGINGIRLKSTETGGNRKLGFSEVKYPSLKNDKRLGSHSSKSSPARQWHSLTTAKGAFCS